MTTNTLPIAKELNPLSIEFHHEGQLLELTVGFDPSGPIFYRSVFEVVNDRPVHEIMRDDEGVNTIALIKRWVDSQGYPVEADFYEGLRICTSPL